METNRKEYEADPMVNELFQGHQEALVIYLDPDEENEGESNVGVYTKVRDGSQLMMMLAAILEQLLHVSTQEHCQHVSSKAAAG